MEKQIIFKGLCTALVTPMKDGKVDYGSLEKLIEFQIEQGVEALLLLGTTGEASTLTPAEKREVAKQAKTMIGYRTKYILGCGANDTAAALRLGENALDFGADAMLVVTPYYNKGTEGGVVRHYLTLAEKIPLPQILYHVPGRTGVRFTLRQLKELSQHPNIVAMKDAHSDIDFLQDAMLATGNALSYYAGNDSLTIPTLSLGGMGVISVISNVFPKEMGDILRLFWEGKREEYLLLHQKLLPLMRLLFAETNPAPIKQALAFLGFGENELRLPMTKVTSALAEKIQTELQNLRK